MPSPRQKLAVFAVLALAIASGCGPSVSGDVDSAEVRALREQAFLNDFRPHAMGLFGELTDSELVDRGDRVCSAVVETPDRLLDGSRDSLAIDMAIELALSTSENGEFVLLATVDEMREFSANIVLSAAFYLCPHLCADFELVWETEICDLFD